MTPLSPARVDDEGVKQLLRPTVENREEVEEASNVAPSSTLRNSVREQQDNGTTTDLNDISSDIGILENLAAPNDASISDERRLQSPGCTATPIIDFGGSEFQELVDQYGRGSDPYGVPIGC